jgi:hypothetical protein
MLSEFELMQSESPGRSDAAVVADIVKDTLRELELEAPIDHNVVASYRGVIRIDHSDHPWAGHIAPTDGGLVISVRADDSSGRQRFTIFHELIHTYMRGFYLEPTQFRCHPGSQQAEAECDPTLELLCDQGAAEMLMPRAEFTEDLAGNTVTWDFVNHLAQRYEASRVATASRICALNSVKTLFLTLEPSTKPRDPLGEPKLRVQTCIGGGAWTYIPRYKSVKPDGVFDRAWCGEVVDETLYLDELTRQPLGWVHVSARRSDYIDDKGDSHMRVRALISQANSSGRRLDR